MNPLTVPMLIPDAAAGQVSQSVDDACRPLLLSMFKVLKELFQHCEEHGRADLASDVVNALAMCQSDFSALAEQIRSFQAEHGLPACR